MDANLTVQEIFAVTFGASTQCANAWEEICADASKHKKGGDSRSLIGHECGAYDFKHDHRKQ